MKNIKLLKVFIASPSDVIDERIVLEDVIKELNVTISDTYNIRLDLVKWETNTSPSVQGKDAQDIINKQLDDDYDIFIGVMWSRAGKKTARAESGTIEEFQRAYSRAKTGEDIEVMFYFNDSPILISEIDVNQIKTIQDFRTTIGEEGLYFWSYKNIKNFESLVRLHLTMKIKNWNKNHTFSIQSEKVIEEMETNTDDETEEGLLDLYSSIMQSSFYLIVSLNGIEKSISEFINEFQERTDEVTRFSDMQNVRSMQFALTKTAIVLDKFADMLEPEVENFNVSLNGCMDSFSKVIAIINNFDRSFANDPEFIKSVDELFSALQQSNIGIEQVNSMLLSIPSLQKNLTKSKKRIVSQFSNMSKLISTALRTIEDIRTIII